MNLKGVSLQTPAVIRLEMFQVLNHTQQSENRERKKKTLTISSSRKDVVAEQEKQEKERRRGKGEKISHPVGEQKHKHQRQRHKTRPASAPQSYSSVLLLFLPKSKDINGTATCTSLTKIHWAFSCGQEVLSTSYIFTLECILQEEWGRKER